MNVRRSIFDNIRSPCWLLVARRRVGERIANAARAKSTDWRQNGSSAAEMCAAAKESREAFRRRSGKREGVVQAVFRLGMEHFGQCLR
jgi:hypothetical protein